jgi:hypothetical protein
MMESLENRMMVVGMSANEKCRHRDSHTNFPTIRMIQILVYQTELEILDAYLSAARATLYRMSVLYTKTVKEIRCYLKTEETCCYTWSLF